MAVSPFCSRTCRCSRRSAHPSDTSSWCSSRSRSSRRSRSTICWRLRSGAGSRRRAGWLALWIPAALGIATTVALNTGLLPYGRHTFARASVAAPGVAIVIAVTLLVFLAGRRVRWAIAALVVVTAVDLAAWGIRFVYREPARTIADTDRRPSSPRPTAWPSPMPLRRRTAGTARISS